MCMTYPSQHAYTYIFPQTHAFFGSHQCDELKRKQVSRQDAFALESAKSSRHTTTE